MSKHLFLSLLLLCAMGFTCPISAIGGLGNQVDELLPDPQVGLDALRDYRATLTISFTGSMDGQNVASTDTYTQSEWPLLGAKFTTIEMAYENGQPLFIVVGDVGNAHYDQEGPEEACYVRWQANAREPSPFRLAVLLDPVRAARSAGQETVEGISTRHYTFDATSLGLPEDVQASGDVWLANQGGYIVKYSLQVTSSGSYFGEGKQGTEQTEYLLSQVEARPEVAYPDGCEPVLTDIPAMENATEVIRLPGLLDYYSNSTLEAIINFYTELFESRDWVIAIDYRPEGQQAMLVFARPDSEEVSMVSVQSHGESMWVSVSVLGQEANTSSPSEPGTTPAPGVGGSPALRVAGALSILLGMDESQVGLPSYHMEAYHNIPAWEGGTVVQYEDWMVADVQGKNIHFNDRVIDPGGSTTTAEAYLMGEEEYDLENGVLQPEGTSMTGLAWTLWPLDPAVILGTAANGAQASGTEVLDGRSAEVYTVDVSGAMGAAAGASLAVTSVSGQVWVDHETGALLKTELDYQADVKDQDGNIKGSGSGRLEITITQVGNVTVTLPGQ
jgi:hypothetical protein